MAFYSYWLHCYHVYFFALISHSLIAHAFFVSCLIVCNSPFDYQTATYLLESSLYTSEEVSIEPIPEMNLDVLPPGFAVLEWDGQ